MNQQVTFSSYTIPYSPGEWVGIVVDEASHRVLTRTILTYTSSDEARFGARIKWLGRNARMAQAAGMAGSAA